MQYVDGFIRFLGPLTDAIRPTAQCDACGREMASVRGSVSAATCSRCVTQGPVGQRKSERLARRKGGKVRK